MKKRSQRPMGAVLACGATAVLTLACGGGDAAPAEEAADTLTQQQRDSLVGASGLPGAGGVRRALDASEAARARAEAHDTVGR